MTFEELERYHYITNSPLHSVYAQMVDLETENHEQYWTIDKLNKRLEDVNERTINT